MPKNPVTDPITDQEMAFAHLVLAGTMNDRHAAEAVGLNPDTAAYTKAKPRVRAYMIEHRAAVEEKLVQHEVEGLRKLNLSRDQILTRLWELANLNPEATRSSIAGQVRALSMIVAIEGLIPDRRHAPSQLQSAAPPPHAPQDVSEGRYQPPNQAKPAEPRDTVTVADTQPATPPHPEPAPPRRPANAAPPLPLGSQAGPLNPFIHPEQVNQVPAAADRTFDAIIHTARPLRLSLSPQVNSPARSR